MTCGTYWGMAHTRWRHTPAAEWGREAAGGAGCEAAGGGDADAQYLAGKTARYCGDVCQKQDWTTGGHRVTCGTYWAGA